jgi:hypothetical protein
VAEVLRSGRVNYWTGEQGKAFEAEFAAACGAKHALAVANGTVALELALYALGVGPGDEVILPCRSSSQRRFETVGAATESSRRFREKDSLLYGELPGTIPRKGLCGVPSKIPVEGCRGTGRDEPGVSRTSDVVGCGLDGHNPGATESDGTCLRRVSGWIALRGES